MVQAREILIVDDEVGIRELLSEILQDEGYRVALAENAGEARAYRQRQQPAMVLLDIWMPDTDGVTLLREWRANALLTMPVIMMSGHDIAARALQTSGAPFVVLQNGARLANNPLSLLEEAREGVLYCMEIGQYSRAEQKGLAFLLPKLDKHGIALVATSAEPLANLAAEGRFDAALLSQLSVGAIVLPPLRARRDDIPALIEQFWRASGADERATPLLASLTPAALTALSGAYWPGNLDHLQSVVANMQVVRGEITADLVKRLLGESASPNQVLAPEITTRFFELPLREAREAFERIYFEQLLGREQSNMSKVAEKAGLERTHLYRKLKQLNIRFSRRTDDSSAPG